MNNTDKDKVSVKDKEKKCVDKDADDDVSGFSLDDGLTHCPECKTELRPAHVVLTQQQFNDNRCNVAVQIGCDCTESQIQFGVNTVEKSTLPEVWRDG